MKKISIVTVHRTLNYGTLLQTYACSALFKEYGYDTCVMDYYRDRDYREADFKNLLSYYRGRCRISAEKGLVGRFRIFGKCLLSFPTTKAFYRICDRFLSERLTLTKPYYSYSDLEKELPAADWYCAGSDQIWNSDYNEGIDPVYYLRFTESSSKFSFCSSIGKTSLGDKEKTILKEALSSFQAVSVREEKAAELLGDIGIKAVNLIDPTLIWDRTFWELFTESCSESFEKKMPVTGPYLLIYKLKADDTLDRVAAKIAKEKNLKIVRIAFDWIRKKNGEITIVLPSVPQFLALIKKADYVVTNSFHGTCFSINFGKQFLAVPRSNYNIRIENILRKLGIEDRLYREDTEAVDYCREIDYSPVRERLDRERQTARDWLKALLDCEKQKNPGDLVPGEFCRKEQL